MRDSEGHMVGLVGLCRVMGEWSVSQWIVGVINFPKIRFEATKQQQNAMLNFVLEFTF